CQRKLPYLCYHRVEFSLRYQTLFASTKNPLEMAQLGWNDFSSGVVQNAINPYFGIKTTLKD
ncbi:MAG: hypothetical protein AAFY48_12475, partial [Bacteroidota bacterium]